MNSRLRQVIGFEATLIALALVTYGLMQQRDHTVTTNDSRLINAAILCLLEDERESYGSANRQQVLLDMGTVDLTPPGLPRWFNGFCATHTRTHSN